MSEQEVANYLRLNPKTLYRYRKSGKLPFHLASGKTRPTIEYEKADVEALKKELERQRTQAANPPSRPPSKTRRVSYGLSPTDYQELEEEAAKCGLKVNEYARRLAREGLESQFRSEAAALRSELKGLAKQVEQMRGESRQNHTITPVQDPAASRAEERQFAELRATIEAVKQQMSQVRQEVQQSSQDFQTKFDEFASGFEALLEFTGLAPEESKQWVDDNLR